MPANYRNGKIYKIINSENNIVYIGSTTEHYLSSRMGDHRIDAKKSMSDFYKAMRAIGIEKFFIKLIKLFPCDTKGELESEEGRQMKRYLRKGVELYNMTIDGKVSQKTRVKMAKSKTGRKHSDATKDKMSKAHSGSKNHMFKRGCVNFNKSKSSWIFRWVVNGKRISKSFSVSKYGDAEAKAKAIAIQDEIYPQ